MMYTFKKPFTLDTGGNQESITFIEFVEPGFESQSDMNQIGSFVGRVYERLQEKLSLDEETIESIQEASDKQKKEKLDEDESQSVDDIVKLLKATPVDATSAFSALKKIMKQTNVKLNGEFACSGGNLNGVPFTAAREILGAYIANFHNLSS